MNKAQSCELRYCELRYYNFTLREITLNSHVSLEFMFVVRLNQVYFCS